MANSGRGIEAVLSRSGLMRNRLITQMLHAFETRLRQGWDKEENRMSDGAATMSKPARDVRLDFFRGLAMFIIFIAHMPANSWFLFIPARFGFSSAGELFVFCSGLASSFAFGRVFVREGWLAGTRRILYRLWQVYWAHIGLALALITVSVIGLEVTGIDYPGAIGLDWFLAHAGEGMLKLMTLRFTPTFLDILPMYLVLLAMVPAMMALARLSRLLPLLAMAGMWLMVQIYGANLSGGQMPGMVWFFDPFAWQLVFFTGFAFGMRWLPVPKFEKGPLFWLCVAVLVASVPVNFWAFTENIPVLADIHNGFVPEDGKTHLVLPLYLHFLASAYVVLTLVESVKARLIEIRPVILVGQQALATFIASIILAWVGGMVLDQIGRSEAALALVNLAGFAGLVAVALIARGYKGGGSGKGPLPAGRRQEPAPQQDATSRLMARTTGG
jgi:hypothetical protein